MEKIIIAAILILGGVIWFYYASAPKTIESKPKQEQKIIRKTPRGEVSVATTAEKNPQAPFPELECPDPDGTDNGIIRLKKLEKNLKERPTSFREQLSTEHFNTPWDFQKAEELVNAHEDTLAYLIELSEAPYLAYPRIEKAETPLPQLALIRAANRVLLIAAEYYFYEKKKEEGMRMLTAALRLSRLYREYPSCRIEFIMTFHIDRNNLRNIERMIKNKWITPEDYAFLIQLMPTRKQYAAAIPYFCNGEYAIASDRLRMVHTLDDATLKKSNEFALYTSPRIAALKANKPEGIKKALLREYRRFQQTIEKNIPPAVPDKNKPAEDPYAYLNREGKLFLERSVPSESESKQINDFITRLFEIRKQLR